MLAATMSDTANSAASVGEISPLELQLRIEAGAELQLLDVRAPQRLSAGQVEPSAAQRFLNIPGSQMLALPDPEQAGLSRQRPVVVICSRGRDSLVIAGHLGQLGYQASSLGGGMLRWMQTLVPRKLAAPAGFDQLIQFDRIGKGSLGYLLISGAEAFVIDPPQDYEPYLQAAAAAEARIVGVAETHVHADYISGGADLAIRCGVPYYVHPADNVYPYDGRPGRLSISPLSDGQQIPVGAGLLTARHTPGHTEGSISYLAGESAAFTGDFLFLRSVGRPDLAAKTEAWTAELFASLERAKREWPDSMLIYPAHYGCSAERSADFSVGRSLGEVRADNPSLAISDSAEFLAWVQAHISTPPEAYRIIKAINIGLLQVDEMQAAELEGGRNECALK